MRVRDAVFGDILLGVEEEYCVRTAAFQRLHRIKQLGNAYHIYPSAMHTRFEHSLGVYHQVGKLFQQRSFLSDYPGSVGEDERKLVELAGLLHDIAHTPFKHTLDRDTGVVDEPDAESEYASRFDEMKLKDKLGEAQVSALLRILACKDAKDLPKPFHRQMVEDTFSADLLDYSRRDAYFTTGVKRNWDERIYDHIAVAMYGGKPHLMAKLTDESGKLTASAITELVNLLQIRYVLNERVYFYASKIAADSLLVKSIRNLLLSGAMDGGKFNAFTRNMSDEELVRYLASSEDPAVSTYGQRLHNRELPGLAGSYDANDLHPLEVAKTCWGCKAQEKWAKCEANIAQEAKVDPASVIVYCHNPKMQAKAPPPLVRDQHAKPHPISLDDPINKEIEYLSNKHMKLWRCHVFCLNRDQGTLGRVEEAAREVLAAL